jgi:hypothetical protein
MRTNYGCLFVQLYAISMPAAAASVPARMSLNSTQHTGNHNLLQMRVLADGSVEVSLITCSPTSVYIMSARDCAAQLSVEKGCTVR